MQLGELLGFIFDIIRNMEFRIPCRKMNKLKSNLDIMISSGGAYIYRYSDILPRLPDSVLSSLHLAVGTIPDRLRGRLPLLLSRIRFGLAYPVLFGIERRDSVFCIRI